MTVELKNSVFVHVPRIGGMWLRSLLRRTDLIVHEPDSDRERHQSYLEHGRWDKPGFGFVRHPLDWIRSRWSHALQHSTHVDRRFLGVHRLFSLRVRPSFPDTVRAILDECPGVVGHTFDIMLDGVDLVLRTEDLPDAALSALNTLEQIEVESLVPIPETTNGTSTTEKWRRLTSLSDDLMERFLVSERRLIERHYPKGVRR